MNRKNSKLFSKLITLPDLNAVQSKQVGWLNVAIHTKFKIDLQNQDVSTVQKVRLKTNQKFKYRRFNSKVLTKEMLS